MGKVHCKYCNRQFQKGHGIEKHKGACTERHKYKEDLRVRRRKAAEALRKEQKRKKKLERVDKRKAQEKNQPEITKDSEVRFRRISRVYLLKLLPE